MPWKLWPLLSRCFQAGVISGFSRWKTVTVLASIVLAAVVYYKRTRWHGSSKDFHHNMTTTPQLSFKIFKVYTVLISNHDPGPSLRCSGCFCTWLVEEGLNMWSYLNQVSGSRQLFVLRFVFVENVQTCHVSALGWVFLPSRLKYEDLFFFFWQTVIWGHFYYRLFRFAFTLWVNLLNGANSNQPWTKTKVSLTQNSLLSLLNLFFFFKKTTPWWYWEIFLINEKKKTTSCKPDCVNCLSVI